MGKWVYEVGLRDEFYVLLEICHPGHLAGVSAKKKNLLLDRESPRTFPAIPLKAHSMPLGL